MSSPLPPDTLPDALTLCRPKPPCASPMPGCATHTAMPCSTPAPLRPIAAARRARRGRLPRPRHRMPPGRTPNPSPAYAPRFVPIRAATARPQARGPGPHLSLCKGARPARNPEPRPPAAPAPRRSRRRRGRGAAGGGAPGLGGGRAGRRRRRRRGGCASAARRQRGRRAGAPGPLSPPPLRRTISFALPRALAPPAAAPASPRTPVPAGSHRAPLARAPAHPAARAGEVAGRPPSRLRPAAPPGAARPRSPAPWRRAASSRTTTTWACSPS
jgi:hypothetical protein